MKNLGLSKLLERLSGNWVNEPSYYMNESTPLSEGDEYQFLYGLSQMAFAFFTRLHNQDSDISDLLNRSRETLRDNIGSDELFLAYGYILTFRAHDGKDKRKNTSALKFLYEVLNEVEEKNLSLKELELYSSLMLIYKITSKKY